MEGFVFDLQRFAGDPSDVYDVFLGSCLDGTYYIFAKVGNTIGEPNDYFATPSKDKPIGSYIKVEVSGNNRNVSVSSEFGSGNTIRINLPIGKYTSTNSVITIQNSGYTPKYEITGVNGLRINNPDSSNSVVCGSGGLR